MDIMDMLMDDQSVIHVCQDYIHRKIADNDVLISIGQNIAKFNGFIELNETASYLWDRMSEDISIKELSQCLVRKYGISYEIALSDTQSFLKILLENEMIEVL